MVQVEFLGSLHGDLVLVVEKLGRASKSPYLVLRGLACG